jgi:hypothetical protein
MGEQILRLLGEGFPVDVALDIASFSPVLLVGSFRVLLEESLSTLLPVLQIAIFEQGGLYSEDIISDDISLTADEMVDVGFNVDLDFIKDEISQKTSSGCIEIDLAVNQ